MPTHYLACDLGAESGRLMLGTLADGELALEELHRFPNTPARTGESLHWNIPALFAELKAGLKKAAARELKYSGLSTDSWGVDYLLFDAQGQLMSPTFHYRDPRTALGVKNAYAKTDWPTIFAESGIQYMPLNTLFQLMAETPERLQQATLILGVGDGFNYLLSGRACVEVSMASTFQLYNPVKRAWSRKLIDVLGLPPAIFPQIVPSGTRLGPLKEDLAKETGLAPMEIIASCSHDTGAAVVAVPASGTNWAYLSSGTWSLMGVELAKPIINDQSREFNFTNEIGINHSVRLLKNIIGMWVVQECRRDWAAQGREYGYDELTQLATQAPPFASLINPADPRFVPPGQMPKNIADYCRETNQPAPTEPGAVIRCVLESLALLYAKTLRQIEQLTGNPVQRLHVVGGGSRNNLLNQFTANATGIPVEAGPVEATAAGNVLIQAIALGDLESLTEAREVMRASSHTTIFEPQEQAVWASTREGFSKLP